MFRSGGQRFTPRFTASPTARKKNLHSVQKAYADCIARVSFVCG